MDNIFDQVLSDAAQTYKPDARAYQLGVEASGCLRKNSVVAFAGWDAAGAESFGYPTFWVYRLGIPPEELDVRADATGSKLTDSSAFIG